MSGTTEYIIAMTDAGEKFLASAIEARRAATLGAVHESAGLQGDAQTSPPKDL